MKKDIPLGFTVWAMKKEIYIIMEKREDIRITKSKRDLCNALVELMKSTPFKKITVGDICSTAMINKMTFYKHYADKEKKYEYKAWKDHLLFSFLYFIHYLDYFLFAV